MQPQDGLFPPKLSDALYLFFHEGEGKLNEEEWWNYKMFWLWHETHKAPWEWTGDPKIYPEDITAFFKMAEFDASGHKHRAAKAERKANRKKGAGIG